MTFDEIVESIKTRAAGADAIGAKIKFALGDGQNILIDGTGDGNAVTTEDGDADTTVKSSMDDFTSLMKGDLNPMGAVMSGKIKIDGNMGLAMKLQSFLG